MINIRREIEEPDGVDTKKGRLRLEIGKLKFRITRQEAKRLRGQLNRFKL